MQEFLIGFTAGGCTVAAVWFYRAKILGYATKEIDELRAKVRQLGGAL